MINSTNLRISADVRALFDTSKLTKRIEGRVSSNLDYMPYLDKDPGHSQQAPHGIIAPHMAEYQAVVAANLRQSLAMYPGDIQKAAESGISFATLGVLGLITNYTPVDTGRARSSWVATLPGGRIIRGGAVVTAEMQRAHHKAKRAVAASKKRTK